MINYIVPLTALVFDFACFAFCIKFMITSEWRYWIVPTLLSLAITVASIMCTLSIALENSQEQIISFAFSVAIVLGIVSILWFATILLFAYRLKEKED